jgi:hypothetical protein
MSVRKLGTDVRYPSLTTQINGWRLSVTLAETTRRQGTLIMI